jgi:F420-dependent oxidoreductase-like protein
VDFGLDVSQHQLSWDEILERTRFAEDAGFDGAWVFDHFQPLYGDRSGPCFEGWTLIAGLATVTDRIRLGTLVTGMTYRHPSILAAEAITVDHLSRGRLELGVGAAWFEQEHIELGIDFPGARVRAERLEEGVQVLRHLMMEPSSSFRGKHFRLERAHLGPPPVQQPHPPLWIGAGGEKRMLPLVGRYADVWHGFGSVADLARKSRIVDEHATKAGRDPASIRRATALSLSEPWEEVKARIEALADAGFSYLTVSYPSEGRGRLEEFTAGVMPTYTG